MPQKVSIFLPQLPGAPPRKSLIADVAEALRQIRLADVHAVVTTTIRDQPSTPALFSSLTAIMPLHEIQLTAGSTIHDILHELINWCRETDTNGLLIMPVGSVVPNAFQELHNAAVMFPTFGAFSPRTNLDTIDNVSSISSTHASNITSDEQAYLEYFELASQLPRMVLTARPGVNCIYLTTSFLRTNIVVDRSYQSLAAVLWNALADDSKGGQVVARVNTAFSFVDLQTARSTGLLPTENEYFQLKSSRPRFRESDELFAAIPQVSYERVRSQVSNLTGTSRKVILDLSGIGQGFQPLGELAKGLLHSISARRDWNISVHCSAEAAKWQPIRGQFSHATFISDDEENKFFRKDPGACVVRLGLPSTLSQFARMANYGVFLFVMIPEALDFPEGMPIESIVQALAVSHLIASWADALIFPSKETQERFGAMCPVAGDVHQMTMLPSTYAKEYSAVPIREMSATSTTILIIGNDTLPSVYSLIPTLVLASCPEARVRAIGRFPGGHNNLQVKAAIELSCAQVEQSYNDTDIIIVPHAVELHIACIAQALSVGKIVLAPRCQLLDDVASHWSGPGVLEMYSSEAQLAQLLQKLGQPAERQKATRISLSHSVKDGQACRWSKAGQVFAELLTHMEVGDPARRRYYGRLAVTQAYIAAFAEERNRLLANVQSIVQDAEKNLEAAQQRIKELEAAHKLLLQSKPYQIGKACTNALSSIPGLKSFTGE